MIRFLTLCSGLVLLTAGLNLRAQTRVEVSHRPADTAPRRCAITTSSRTSGSPRRARKLEFGADGRGKYRFDAEGSRRGGQRPGGLAELAARVGASSASCASSRAAKTTSTRRLLAPRQDHCRRGARRPRAAATFNYTDNERMTRLVEISATLPPRSGASSTSRTSARPTRSRPGAAAAARERAQVEADRRAAAPRPAASGAAHRRERPAHRPQPCRAPHQNDR